MEMYSVLCTGCPHLPFASLFQQRINILIYSMVYVSRNKIGGRKERKREAKYFSESTFMLGRAWGDWRLQC